MRRPFADRRLALGLSLDRAAARLRISVSHLRALERGSAPLTQPMAAKLATVYACKIQTLVTQEPAERHDRRGNLSRRGKAA